MARQDIKKTGWPEGLLQDDDGRLSRWFASRPDARYVLKRNLEKQNEIEKDKRSVPSGQELPEQGQSGQD
jgi:hypothetical protein